MKNKIILNSMYLNKIYLNPILLGWALLSALLSVNAQATDKATTLNLNAKQLQSMQVLWQKPTLGQTQRSASYPAEVSLPPSQVRVVASAQAGLIEQLNVSVGDMVKQGQLLGRISSQGLVSLQSEYLQASTQARLHAAAFQRDRELFNDGIIAQRRFLETQSAHETSQALLNERKQALRLAGMAEAQIQQLRLSQQLQSSLSLFAPMSGQVSAQHLQVGARVEMATPIYTIHQSKPLWLLIQVPIEQAQAFQIGSPVEVLTLGIQGRVEAILRQLNKSNQSVTVRASVNEGAERLSVGQMVNVQCLKTQNSQTQNNRLDTISVPKSALVKQGEQNYVFVRTGFGKQPIIKVMPVQVLQIQSEQALLSQLPNQAIPTDADIAVQGTAALKGHWLGLGQGGQ